MISNKVFDLFENTIHVGTMKNEPGVSHVLYGSVDSHLVVKFDVKLNKDIVEKAVFKAYGNLNTIAVAEFLCNFVEGKSISEIAQTMDANLIIESLELETSEFTVAYALVSAMNKALHSWIDNFIILKKGASAPFCFC